MLPASFSELDLIVLALLHDDPCHGYVLVQRLREQCSQSAVYRCLRRLRELQLIDDKIVAQGKMPNRHHFTLSSSGRQTLKAQGSWTDDLQSRFDRASRQYRKLNLLLSFRPAA